MKRYLYFSDINQIADINLKNYIFENIDKDIKIDFFTSFGSTRNFNKKSIANYKNIKWINIFQKILIKLNLYKIDRNYRGLIIGSLKNNKVNFIHDYLDIKKLLVKKFKKNSKKVIQVFDSSCFDFTVDLNADKYLIPSKFIRDNYIPKRLHKKCIFTGIIFNQCRIDNLLNKKEFFFKYNLEKRLKLIAIYPPRFDRLKDPTCSNINDFDFFCRLEKINKQIKKNGFQFAIKLHRYDYFKHKFNTNTLKRFGFPNELIENKIHPSDYYLRGIPKINDNDFAELVNYSNCSIIFSSGLVYFHHIFKKPTIFIGKLWPRDRNININKDKRYLKNLIFGKILEGLSKKNNQEICSEICKVAKNYDFDEFIYNKEHPITGEESIDGLSLFSKLLKE